MNMNILSNGQVQMQIDTITNSKILPHMIRCSSTEENLLGQHEEALKFGTLQITLEGTKGSLTGF